MRDELILDLLDFDQFAEFIGLLGLAFANDLRLRFKHTDQLALRARVPLQHALARLPHNLLHPRNHFLQLTSRLAEQLAIPALNPFSNLLRELLPCPTTRLVASSNAT